MHALQPSPPPPQRRPPTRQLRQARSKPYQATATEVTVRLVANGILLLIATTTLLRLVPYSLKQQEELRQIQAEVAEKTARVDRLEASLNRNFDPTQSFSVMQEQSVRVDPSQRPIVWLEPLNATAPTPSAPQEAKPQRAGLTLPPFLRMLGQGLAAPMRKSSSDKLQD